MKAGFNDSNGNSWIGNDQLNSLTSTGRYKLVINMWWISGVQYSVEYKTFTVGDETSGYLLHQGGYNGTVGNCLSYNEGMPFSTYDQDSTFKACPVYDKGSWWYYIADDVCTYAGSNNERYTSDGFTWSCGFMGTEAMSKTEMWLMCL